MEGISNYLPTIVTNDLYFMIFLNDRYRFSLNRNFADKTFYHSTPLKLLVDSIETDFIKKKSKTLE